MEKTDKREQIMEAAIRRFAHFGVQKTTLTEIADDLGMTKQSLMYYFTDKQSIAAAVEIMILDEFFSMVNENLSKTNGLEEALFSLIETKRVFVEKYSMLMHAAKNEGVHNQFHQSESHKKFRERMIAILIDVLNQAMKSGEIKSAHTQEIANVVFDTITAYEQCVVNKQVVPDLKEFDQLCERQRAVISLMVNGLK